MSMHPTNNTEHQNQIQDRDPVEATLNISDAAASKVRELMEEEGSRELCLRALVTAEGCQGLKYGFAFDKMTDIDAAADSVFKTKDITLVVEQATLNTYLKGSTIDYQTDISGERFVVYNNPNAASSCGCGVSFCEKRDSDNDSDEAC